MSWKLESEKAEWGRGKIRLQLDPRIPQNGCELTTDKLDKWRVLSVSPQPNNSLEVQEAYVRQDDLIVRFGQGEKDLYGLQLDWRHTEVTHAQFAIELWISIQTSLLDTYPNLLLTSDTPGDSWDSIPLRDLVDDSNSKRAAIYASRTKHEMVAIMIHASDVEQAQEVTTNRKTACCTKLFGAFLEKGVIRRARVSAVVFDGHPSMNRIRAAYAEVSSQPLPLTA